MDATCQHLLAGAGFTQQQYGGVGGRDFFHGTADLQHGLAAGDQPLQGRAALFGGEHPVLDFQCMDMQGTGDHQGQHVRVEGFLEKVVGTEMDCFHCIAAIEVAGDDDDLGRRREREDLLQCRQAFGGAVDVGWQAEVEQHDRGLVATQLGDGTVAVDGHDQFVIGEAPLQLLLQSGIVFDQQYLLFGVAHAASPPAGE